MRIFGFELKLKKQPRWASYDDVISLSESVQSLFNAYEAMRKKVYRETKKDNGAGQDDVIPEEVPRPVIISPGDPPPAGYGV